MDRQYNDKGGAVNQRDEQKYNDKGGAVNQRDGQTIQ
jgi:hypothetical protein